MLGQRISLLRRQAGMSQAALAAHLGISPSAVGMYEQGRREPSVELLIRLSELFGVTADYLLTGRVTDSRDLQMLENLLQQRLDEAQRRLESRSAGALTRQELTALFAAALLE